MNLYNVSSGKKFGLPFMSQLNKKINRSSQKKFHIALIFLLVTLSFVSIDNAYSIGITLGTTVNLSNNAGISFQPQISISGSNIHTVWRDTTSSAILYSNSTDGGTTFVIPSIISSTSTPQNPHMSVSGSNVYVVWNAISGNSDVFFSKSTDNGVTFSTPVNLSSNTGTSQNQRIAISGSTVSVVWEDDTLGTNEIFYSESTDSGLTFNGGTLSSPGSPLNLSSGGLTPQVKISSGKINVIWTSSISGSGDIFYTQSTGGSSVFSTPVNISNLSGSSITPQIATGTNISIVWDDNNLGNKEIFYSVSADGGSTFSSPVNLSGTSQQSQEPQLTISGNNVYVVWSDGPASGYDILYSKSADDGITFNGGTVSSPGASVNLSGNSGDSTVPQIAASGANVNMVWSDTTSGNAGILLIASDDSGNSFSGISNLSGTATSITPQIATSGNNGYVVWEDVAGTDDIFFRSSTNSAIGVVFDTSQYKLSDSATVTVTDPGSNTNSVNADTISINVKSTSDTSGIPLTLTETGQNTGIFTSSLSFSTISGSAILQAVQGDTITATFGLVTGTASIFPRTIDFSGITTFDGGAIANVRVTDQNSNLNTASTETIQVTVQTNSNPTGITLSLTETGTNTGIFGGASSQLLFSYGNDGLFPTDNTLTISQNDAIANTDTNAIDTTTVTISSTSDVGFSMVLPETNINTGIFSDILSLSSTSANHPANTLLAPGSDILAVSHGGKISHGLVTPNSNPSVGIIQIADSGSDTLTASYMGITSTATVFDASAPGGGGGGLVRPGLVINALAGLGGGGSSASAPSISLNDLVARSLIDVPPEIEQIVFAHNSAIPIPPMNLDSFGDFDFPLVLNDKGFVLGGFTNTLETQTLKTNTPVIMKFTIYESEKIQHFSLYTNLMDDNTAIHQSDTKILYNNGKELQVIDPQGFFADAKITVTEMDDIKKQVLVEITFAKPMDTSDVIIRSWDPRLQ